MRRERITPGTLRRHGHRGDISVPAWALPQTSQPDRPRVSQLGQTVGRIDELIDREHEALEQGNWSLAETLRTQRDNSVVGLLAYGLPGGDLPLGASVRFGPSDSDPNRIIRIFVTAKDLRRTYHLKDKAAKTPAQKEVIDKARAVIRSRG